MNKGDSTMRRFKKTGDIKVGTIGYGAAFQIGRVQLEDMGRAGMVPTAVAELDPERRSAAEKDFLGIRTYGSASEMLKKSPVDLVAVITPHNSHAKLALQCLRAGRHVVCEKPFAITTAECDAMINEAHKRKLLLSAYHNRHWDGCILEAVKQIRQKNVIGDIVRVEAHMGGYGKPRSWWRSSKSISGGLLYDWGVHILEYALQLIDSDIVEVAGFAKRGVWAPKTLWREDTNEDDATAIVRFDSGVRLTLTMSSIDANTKGRFLEVTGTEGTYVMEHQTYEIIKAARNRTMIVRGNNTHARWHEFYRNVANHLVRGEKLVITPEWARRPIHILDLADRSARQKRALRAKYG